MTLGVHLEGGGDNLSVYEELRTKTWPRHSPGTVHNNPLWEAPPGKETDTPEREKQGEETVVVAPPPHTRPAEVPWLWENETTPPRGKGRGPLNYSLLLCRAAVKNVHGSDHSHYTYYTRSGKCRKAHMRNENPHYPIAWRSHS